MQKACAQCGRPYEALSDRALYCGGACRAIASLGRRAEVASVHLGGGQ